MIVAHYTSLYSIPFGILVFLLFIFTIKIAYHFYINMYIQHLRINLSNIHIQMTKKKIFYYHILLLIFLLIVALLFTNLLGAVLAIPISLYIPVIVISKLKQQLYWSSNSGHFY